MMFTPPRFVVVDDKPEHLTAILNVFQSLGTPCLGVVYDPEYGLEDRSFEGVSSPVSGSSPDRSGGDYGRVPTLRRHRRHPPGEHQLRRWAIHPRGLDGV